MTVWSSFALEWNSCVWISSVDRESESKKERGGRRETERERVNKREGEKGERQFNCFSYSKTLSHKN